MADLSELSRCRLCAAENNLTDAVFPSDASPNQELIDMISACTSIRITFERDFPCTVCSGCVRIVKQFYAYRRKCLNHNRELERLRGGETSKDGGGGGGELEAVVEDVGRVEYAGLEEYADPLSVSPGESVKRKSGHGLPAVPKDDDEGFYGRVKKEVRSFLEVEVKKVEEKAMDKVSEALQKRKRGSTSPKKAALDRSVEFVHTSEEPTDYEMLSETEETTEEGFKVETESIYFLDPEEDYTGETTTNETEAEAEESTTLNGSTTLEAQRKIDTLMQLNHELDAKRTRLSGDREVVQKEKVKSMDHMGKLHQKSPSAALVPNPSAYKNRSSGERSQNPPPMGCFTEHPEIPEIKPKFLQTLNTHCEEGIRGDRQFVTKLAVAVFGAETLAKSTVTGKQSVKYPNQPPFELLCQGKILAIQAKLLERVQLEIGFSNPQELLSRASLKVVRFTVNQKVQNLRRPGKRSSLFGATRRSEGEAKKEQEEKDGAENDDGGDDMYVLVSQHKRPRSRQN